MVTVSDGLVSGLSLVKSSPAESLTGPQTCQTQIQFKNQRPTKTRKKPNKLQIPCTHRERLRPLLDHKALYEVCKNLRFNHSLRWRSSLTLTTSPTGHQQHWRRRGCRRRRWRRRRSSSRAWRGERKINTVFHRECVLTVFYRDVFLCYYLHRRDWLGWPRHDL